MNNDTDKLLQTELRAFSSHDWEKDGVLSFASILLSFKRNTELQWHIKHDSRCKLIIDSTIAPADIFIPLSKYDHFLQVRIGEDTYLFLFAPAKSSMVELDCLIGAYIKAEMYSRTFPSKKRVSGIENLSFIIRPSEFVGIYGESGIGKSVLINSVLGTIQDGRVSGTLSIEDGCGEIIRQDEISYLPQIVDIPPHLRCEEILQAAALDRSIDGAYSVSDIKDVLSRC